jgi:pentapeptide MXKDX repeat protein
MFKTKIALLSLLLTSVLLIAACSPQSQSSSEEMEEEPMVEEEMSEDEMMDDEMSDDEMSDDEMMDDEMSEDEMMDESTTFVVRIENISDEGGLTVLAPGAYELNDHPVSFFTVGEADRDQGLEALAEDGDPSFLVDTINGMMEGDMMGFAIELFNTPVGADAPGPAGPGAAYEFTIEAHPGQYLTLATMFVHSNDWFFAPNEEGIALYDMDGNPVGGDVTDQIYLWDAGTEVDQVPGEGVDQAPRQAGPNTGEAEDGLVSLVEDFTNYQIVVSITPQG